MWHKALGITTRIAEDEVNEWCGGWCGTGFWGPMLIGGCITTGVAEDEADGVAVGDMVVGDAFTPWAIGDASAVVELSNSGMTIQTEVYLTKKKKKPNSLSLTI
jgi:hypothetical protein